MAEGAAKDGFLLHDLVMAEHARPKDRSIQTLRGVAVLLMVAGHVIGSSGGRGMNVADDSIWRWFYVALEDIRMPLFTVISGHVYAMRPIRSFADYPSLARGKARRLLIPLVTVGLLLFVLQISVPGTNSRPELNELAWFFVFPFHYGHLWFLQSMFLIFLTVAALDACGVTRTRAGWAIATVSALVVFVAVRVPSSADVFSVNGYFRLLPFFLIGYGLHRYGVEKGRRVAVGVTLLAFLAVYSARTIGTVNEWNLAPRVDRVLELAVGMTGVVLIYSARRLVDWAPLAWVGGFSFGIYLLHVFGSAASRIFARAMGIDADVALFVIGMVAGVGLPIMFQLIFGRWNLVWVGILGEKRRRSDRAASVHV